MNRDIINKEFYNFLQIRNKYQDKKRADDKLIKLINKTQPSEVRDTDEYKEYINTLIDNMDHMYNKKDLLGIFNEFNIEDFNQVFNTIKDKEKFLQNFLIFNNVKDIYTLNTKYQSVVDFFTIILNSELMETAIINLSAELTGILDIEKNNILNRVNKLDEILEKINQIIFTSKPEKKNFGEVFTALFLINQMLDKLPKSVWKNPYLKWLDPANGYGNFPVVVVKRLMEGLEDIVIPETNLKDPELRYKWIMEKMIYICDINIKNMKIYQELFDREHKLGLKLNYFRGSFLKGFTNKMVEWGVKEFDIIMGNPPFNNLQFAKGKRGGGDSLWDKFVVKSISLLKTNGYLVFVHPAAWRKPESKNSKNNGLFELMKSYQIHYLEIHNTEDGLKTFNSGTRYDFYLLEKIKKYKNTLIIDEDGNNHFLDLDEWDFLPNKNFEIIKKILAKKSDKKCEIIFNRTNYGTDKPGWVSDKKDSIFKYTLIHTTPKSGVRYYYSSLNNKGHFGISKVIFGDSGINDPILDIKGEYGMTQHAMAIKIDSIDEGLMVKKALISDSFIEILDSASWSNFGIDWRFFSFLKKDWYNEIDTTKNNTNIVKPEKSVGANIAEDSYDFKVGERYEYTGRSKTVKKGEVELVKILKTTFRIKDNIGNILNVQKSTLKIKN